MGFLRRLIGRPPDADVGEEAPSPSSETETPPASVRTDDDEERARELELARFEQDRTTDLVRRQQMYSDKSWVPPAQGGMERADDEESGSG